MKQILKIIVLLFFIITPYTLAQEKVTGAIQQVNSSEQEETISFKIGKRLFLDTELAIFENSIIAVRILNIQDARRWHKSAYLVTKLISYTTMPDEIVVNLEDKDIYMLIRKYEAVDKKEMAKTIAELTATTAASFVVPGVDIVYYFTKGAIKKEEGKTRFKSGVSSAYENSIFWFWLKGKALDLNENAAIKIEKIDKDKAMKLKSNIEKREEKKLRMEEKKEAVKEFMSY